MKILFITHNYFPHIGGVEKHTFEVAQNLKNKDHEITILTEKDTNNLQNVETIYGIKVIRFSHLHMKFLGLISIWLQLLKNRELINKADVVHCHDVFIWYLPFRFLFPNKPVYTTFHGWEEILPIPLKNILLKRLAEKLSFGTIAVGKYIEKYYGIKANKITYGAAKDVFPIFHKENNKIIYVGRLEKNTGLPKFLKWLQKNKKYNVDFCGDGELRKKCEKCGTVHGFVDPEQYYKKAEYCVPGGYLSALEALNNNCKIKLFWNNKVKEDYWKLSPFIKKDVKTWFRNQTWDKLANEYLDLYNSI
jgi:glycosyltransferase involved in cell wall biosynthesis